MRENISVALFLASLKIEFECYSAFVAAYLPGVHHLAHTHIACSLRGCIQLIKGCIQLIKGCYLLSGL